MSANFFKNLPRPLIYVLALALCLRIIYFLAFNINNFDFGDSPHYIQLAKNLAAGDGFTIFKEGIIARDYEGDFGPVADVLDPEQLKILENYYYLIVPFGKPNTFWDPLLPLIMSVFVFIGDSNFIFFNLLGCLLGTLSCYILYLIGKNLFNPSTGIIAALIMALEFNSIHYSSILMTENLAIFLLLLNFIFMYKLLDSSRIAGFVILGGIAGLAYLSRANLMIMLPILLVYFYIKFPRLKSRIIFIIIGFIIVCAPWWTRNVISTGHITVLPTKGVYNLWKSVADGVFLASERGYNIRQNLEKSMREVEQTVDYPQALYFTMVEGQTEHKRAASLRKHTYKFMHANPVLTVKRYFLHLWGYFNPVPIWGSNYFKIFLAGTYLFILITGILGIISALRKRINILPLVYYLVIFSLIAGMFRLGYRFRMPVMPVFMLLSGYYLVSNFKFIEKTLSLLSKSNRT